MNLKVKIMKRPPEVTEEELKSYMNFDQVLQQRNAIVRKMNIFKAGLGISGVALISALYFFSPSAVDKQEANAVESEPLVEQIVPPVIDSVTNDVTVNDTKQGIELPPKTTTEVSKEKTEVVKETSPIRAEASQVPESVYVQAEPVAGYDNLFGYFKKNLIYPKEAIPDSVQGILTVSFVVNKEGKIQSIEFPKTLGTPFEKEALKLIQGMPAWKPATLNGKNVNSKINLPLTFELVKHPK